MKYTLQEVCQANSPFLQERRAELVFTKHQLRTADLERGLKLTEKALWGQRWHGTTRIRKGQQKLASQIIELGISVIFSMTGSSTS